MLFVIYLTKHLTNFSTCSLVKDLFLLSHCLPAKFCLAIAIETCDNKATKKKLTWINSIFYYDC